MLKDFFIPSPSNNYYPIGLRNKFLYTYIVFAVIFNLLSIGFIKYFPINKTVDIKKSDIISEINKSRASAHLTPLKEDTILNLAADKKAEDMSKFNYFADKNPSTNQYLESFIPDTNVYTEIKENLAQGYTNSLDAIKNWMNKKVNREKILSSEVNTIGIGISYFKDGSQNIANIVQIAANNPDNTSSTNSDKIQSVNKGFNILNLSFGNINFISIVNIVFSLFLLTLLIFDIVYFKNYKKVETRINSSSAHLPIVFLLTIVCLFATSGKII